MRTTHTRSERIIGLDVVRAIAILTVVISHSLPFLAPLQNRGWVGKPLSIALTNIETLGLLGVELFFVLSGFLIGNILIKTMPDQGALPASELRNFWVRRWYRTLPAYWLILTVNIVLYKAIDLQQVEAYKFLFYPFLQNLWYPNPQFFFGEAWSLSVEEWFYITLPLTLFVSSLLIRYRDKEKFLIRIFVIYLLAFALIRMFNAFHPLNGPDQDSGIRKVVLFRLDAVMFGVLFAYLKNYRFAFLQKVKVPLFIVSLVSFPVLYYLIATPGITIARSEDPAIKWFSDAFLYLFIPLLFSCCLPFAFSVRHIRSKHLSAAVQHVSKVSYSMYLVHYSLIYIPFFYFLKLESTITILSLYLLYWVLVFGCSTLLYRFVELPILRYRDRISHP